MAKRTSVRHRRRNRIQNTFELQLTSMLDVVVILVVFLLKSMSLTTSSVSPTPGLELPVSSSPQIPSESPQLVITRDAMIFDGNRIVEFRVSGDASDTTSLVQIKKADLDEGGRRIVPLYSALVESREKSELLRARSSARDPRGNPMAFEGVLAIQADKRLQYDVVRKVLYTAGTAGFRVFRFLAQKKDE